MGKNTTILLRLIFLVVLVIPFLKAQGASWGAVSDSDNHTATFHWGWPVEDSTALACTTFEGCLVGVGPWDPKGGPPYGGINNPAYVLHVVVSYGTTVKEVHRQWTELRGTSGSYRKYMWANELDLSNTCFGFQTFPGTGASTRTGTLLPGTSCGLVPPPNLACAVSMPSLINLGTYTVGASGVSAVKQGSVSCNIRASIYMSLVSQAKLDGNKVNVEINGKSMGTSPVIVGNGTYVPISVKNTVVGALNNTGVFQSSYTLVISYA
ncbi:hypothetical protein [Serratia marcescens]|uniref:hypothetical protein n=1 Tax=Serratia marcescens TaxID=615 RepID=UPI002407261F|nr:hypothetical protein [Serratia marcescens]